MSFSAVANLIWLENESAVSIYRGKKSNSSTVISHILPLSVMNAFMNYSVSQLLVAYQISVIDITLKVKLIFHISRSVMESLVKK